MTKIIPQRNDFFANNDESMQLLSKLIKIIFVTKLFFLGADNNKRKRKRL